MATDKFDAPVGSTSETRGAAALCLSMVEALPKHSDPLSIVEWAAKTDEILAALAARGSSDLSAAMRVIRGH